MLKRIELEKNKIAKKSDIPFLIIFIISTLVVVILKLPLINAGFILIGLLGLRGIILEIIFAYKEKQLKIAERGNMLFRTNMLRSYAAIYLFLSIILDYHSLKISPLMYSAKILICTHYLFYDGIYGIKTKRGWIGGFPMTKSFAIVASIGKIIFALLAFIFI